MSCFMAVVLEGEGELTIGIYVCAMNGYACSSSWLIQIWPPLVPKTLDVSRRNVKLKSPTHTH